MKTVFNIIDSIPTNLSSNSTQQVERLENYVKEDIDMQVDVKVIKTGSGILIGNQQISEGSKSALIIRSGDLGKSGPGPRAKADARANAGVRKTGQTASSGSSIFVKGYTPHNIYCNHYHKGGNMPSCRQAHKNIFPPDDQGKCLKIDLC